MTSYTVDYKINTIPEDIETGITKISGKQEKKLIIQVVEDDRTLRSGICLALKEPDLSFIQSAGVEEAKASFKAQEPNLVILDVNLPDGSGYDYLKWLRKHSSLPVLMLTANDMEMDEVMGLTLGADDYMTKPFSLAVLRARIRALLRRNQNTSHDIYEEDDFFFDFEKLLFTRQGRELSLSTNEQRLLRILVENRGRVLTRNLLVDRIWSDGGEFVDENALSVTMNRLRGKLEGKKAAASYIQTVWPGLHVGIHIQNLCENAAYAVFDRKWTREALGNILDNAVKYSPCAGTVTVSVTEYGLYTAISVKDEGIGIQEDEIPEIFGRFYRAREVQQEEGVGIGLYLAREILRKQDGYIKVGSRLGEGTEFSIYLKKEP